MPKIKQVIKNKNKLSYRADETIFEGRTNRISKVVDSIKRVLNSNKEYVAISAPQIGVNMRLFCMKFNNGEIRTFINPLITKKSNEFVASVETNASVDGKYLTLRNDTIEATYQTPVANIERNAFTGYPGYIYQQMCETLEGVYLDDLGMAVDEDFLNASKEEKEKIVHMLYDTRMKLYKFLKEEIESNEDLKQLDTAVRFMTGVATGEVELMKEDEKHNDN